MVGEGATEFASSPRFGSAFRSRATGIRAKEMEINLVPKEVQGRDLMQVTVEVRLK